MNAPVMNYRCGLILQLICGHFIHLLNQLLQGVLSSSSSFMQSGPMYTEKKRVNDGTCRARQPATQLKPEQC